MNWHEHQEGPGFRGRGGREGREGRGAREGREGPEEGPGEGRGPGRRGPRGMGRGFGRPGGWQNVDVPPADDAQAWFEGRLPDDWFTSVTVTADREEITVLGTLPDEPADQPAAAEGRISRFRAESRESRIQIAEEAEARYRRKVSWGAQLGDVQALFTNVSVPVMTRLRQPERQVLDTLVDAGVARSRSEALAWAVKLTGEHADAWLSNLREAMSEVDKLRAEGPEF